MKCIDFVPENKRVDEMTTHKVASYLVMIKSRYSFLLGRFNYIVIYFNIQQETLKDDTFIWMLASLLVVACYLKLSTKWKAVNQATACLQLWPKLEQYEFGSRPNLHIEVFLSNCANQPAPAYNTLLPLWQERLWLVERLQLMMELDEMDWSFSERWFPSSLELLLERSALWKVFMSSHDLNGLLQQGLCLLEFRFDVILDWKMLWAL